MRIEFKTRGIPLTAGMKAHLERRLGFALDRFGERVERVVVRFEDANGPRGGVDKTCRLDLQLRSAAAVRVSEMDGDLYVAMDRAAHRASRAVAREMERGRALHGGGAPA